jgi:hypothetical protein
MAWKTMRHKTAKGENHMLKNAKNGHKKHQKKIGGSFPLVILLHTWFNAMHGVFHENNITLTQSSPIFCFLCIHGVIGLHSQQSRETMPIVSLHQDKFSVLIDFVNEYATLFIWFPPSSTKPSCLQPCLSQSDIEHQYTLSLNDKQGSLPRRFHFDCHNLSLQIDIPTQYTNTIFVTIMLPCLHGCMSCIYIM